MERKRKDRDRFEKQIPVVRQRYTESYVIIKHSNVSGLVCIGKECKNTHCSFIEEKTILAPQLEVLNIKQYNNFTLNFHLYFANEN